MLTLGKVGCEKLLLHLRICVQIWWKTTSWDFSFQDLASSNFAPSLHTPIASIAIRRKVRHAGLCIRVGEPRLCHYSLWPGSPVSKIAFRCAIFLKQGHKTCLTPYFVPASTPAILTGRPEHRCSLQAGSILATRQWRVLLLDWSLSAAPVLIARLTTSYERPDHFFTAKAS